MSDLSLTTAELLYMGEGLKLIKSVGVTPSGAYALRTARPVVAAKLAVYEATRTERAQLHSRKDAAEQPQKRTDKIDGKSVEVWDIIDEAAFDADHAAILAERIVLPGVRPIKVSEFGGASISEHVMTLLGPLVVEG